MKKELARVNKNIRRKIAHRVTRANKIIDDMVNSMQVRADYRWYMAQMEMIFPLGVDERDWRSKRYIRNFGLEHNLYHLIDAVTENMIRKGRGLSLIAEIDRYE